MLLRTYKLTIKRKNRSTREIAVLKCDAVQCGVIFERNMSESRRDSHFCSVKCINKGRQRTDEWKDDMSLRVTGSGNPFFGKTHKPEIVEKIRLSKLGKTYEEIMGPESAAVQRFLLSETMSGEGNPFWGRKHKPESLELISKNHACMSGSNNPMHGRGDLIAGDRNGSWKGGISKDPYENTFTESLKTTIRKRDKFTCAVCRKKGCDVHHIDYNKTNSDVSNLITLCRSCHMKTNFDRDKWMRFFNDES